MHRIASKRRARRAIAAVYVAVSMTVIMGMAAMAVDLSAMYSAKAELQRAADAAALAAAGQLGAEGVDDVQGAAIEVADQYARLNAVLRTSAGLASESDVEFGKAVYDEDTGRFAFEPSGDAFDSVRVTLRRDESAGSGPIPAMFGKFLGHQSTSMEARAAAVLVPRDISVVIDLSGSMTDDSELVYYDRTDGGYSNLRDVWAALDGPEPSRPYIPGSELETEYADDTGPTFGRMTQWGSPLVAGYNASTDTGLLYYKKGTTTSDSATQTYLTGRGYSTDEASILMGGSKDSDSNHWKNRICVLLGLADWKSGRAGGKYTTGGDGDNKVENSEMTNWAAYPSWRVSGWSWTGYVEWVAGSTYTYGQTEFRYRYGLKTLVDYIITSFPQYSKNNNLWATPEQPTRAVKDAVQTMVNVITALDSLDHVSLEVFATTARHEIDLTDDVQSVPDTLYERQGGHYDTTTNVAGGLIMAIAELSSERARPAASKVVVLMSDGVANTDENGNYLGDGSSAAKEYAYNRAEQLAEMGARIYTVSVGYYVDREMMQQIATIGHGQEFYAAGSPEEYAEQLEAIFRTLGGKRPVALIE